MDESKEKKLAVIFGSIALLPLDKIELDILIFIISMFQENLEIKMIYMPMQLLMRTC